MENSLAGSGIDGIYIVHAKKGYEVHEKRIIELFGKSGLHYEFVTDGDVSNFSESLLNTYFCPEIDSILSKGILSCTLNHILSYEKMIGTQNRYALIFENDPFFLGDFVADIKKIVNEADTLPPGFIISLENTTLEFPSIKKIKKGQLLYEASSGRCAGAYLMDLKAAELILEDLKTTKCCEVIDWWHNSLIERQIIKMYWAHPPLTEQGSHNGMMSSTISSKNKNIIRRFRWTVHKFYKTNILRYLK